MKLHIVYRFSDAPYGGGNQFLKALRAELKRTDVYTARAASADCVIANTNPGSIAYLLRYLAVIHQPVIIRLDGPTSLLRGKDAYLDQLLAKIIGSRPDGLLFQSQWSKEQNKRLFGTAAPVETVIHNAVDNAIFYPSSNQKQSDKTRLIATSWSSNPRKGFDIYTFLDQNLDFARYEMTFVGNSPVAFKNIRAIPPLTSHRLADMLRQHDIYVTASQNDPCSNALLEALACGLPAVAKRSGGHPELLQQGGRLFSGQNDVLAAIDEVATHRARFQRAIPHISIASVARQYIAFAQQVARHHVRQSSWSRIVTSAMLYSRYRGYQLANFFTR